MGRSHKVKLKLPIRFGSDPVCGELLILVEPEAGVQTC
jgi:hypothetical protein